MKHLLLLGNGNVSIVDVDILKWSSLLFAETFLAVYRCCWVFCGVSRLRPLHQRYIIVQTDVVQAIVLWDDRKIFSWIVESVIYISYEQVEYVLCHRGLDILFIKGSRTDTYCLADSSHQFHHFESGQSDFHSQIQIFQINSCRDPTGWNNIWMVNNTLCIGITMFQLFFNLLRKVKQLLQKGITYIDIFVTIFVWYIFVNL